MILSIVVGNIYRIGYGKKEGFGKKNDEDVDEEFETILDEDDKEGMKDEDEDDDEKEKKEGMKDEDDDLEGFRNEGDEFSRRQEIKLKRFAKKLDISGNIII